VVGPDEFVVGVGDVEGLWWCVFFGDELADEVEDFVEFWVGAHGDFGGH